MLVHLNTPTLYNVLALVAYALNLLFHVISYGTNDWCHFTLHGRRVKLGLWQGCILDQSRDSWDCSDSVFGEDIFMSGKRLWSGKRKYGSDWHIGARVLMTISLIVLFLMEFALIGYACIRRLQPYRDRLSGIVMGMAFGLVFITLERKGWVIPSKEEILSMCICSSLSEYYDNFDRSVDKTKENQYEIEETFSNYSKSTLEHWLSSVSGADGISVSSYAESRQNTSEFSGSTEVLNYSQLTSISLSSLESRV
ncbi:hypothetical protein KUTeg_005822 [Tegillarca granosa]|uniref:Uncharacterized protein n=1 Tax=Tegillarca granosa TaxID=220873 RepID=A0ABQ9FH18_TEGGR|nr:hypothetical protein KUTeg_005822 [Tegillarca granosa]